MRTTKAWIWPIAMAACLTGGASAHAADCLSPRVMGKVVNDSCSRVLSGVTTTRDAQVEPAGNAPQAPVPAAKPEPEPAFTGLDVQKALNFFGFSAGYEDGILGRRSRAAISRMQAAIGTQRTGQLTEEEAVFLVETYERVFSRGRTGNKNMVARLWAKRP